MPLPPIPFAPGRVYDPSPGSYSIAQLMLRQGDIAAQRAAQSGQIWGNALANVGQIAGQAVMQHQEEKRAKARDAAVLGFVQDPTIMQDPETAYRKAIALFGPKDGHTVMTGLFSAHELAAKQGEPDDLKTGQMLEGASKMSDAALAQLYPQLRDLSLKTLARRMGKTPEEVAQILPQQWDPAHRGDLMGIAQMLTGKAAPAQSDEYTLTPGAKRFKGSQVIAEVPLAEKPTTLADAALKGDNAAYQALLKVERDKAAAGRAPGSGKPEQYIVEVPGPNGTIVKRLATEAEMRSGITMAPKSTGQKPVTGAERQSLAFYNRAQSAAEEIAPLETNVAKYGVLDQQRLSYEGTGSNYLKSEEMQRYRQAQRAFTEARLRKESGAAIPQSEFDNDARTYFAQPGDTPKTIAQKQRERARVLDGLRYSAGKAYDEYYGEPAKREAAGPLKVGGYTVEVE